MAPLPFGTMASDDSSAGTWSQPRVVLDAVVDEREDARGALGDGTAGRRCAGAANVGAGDASDDTNDSLEVGEPCRNHVRASGLGVDADTGNGAGKVPSLLLVDARADVDVGLHGHAGHGNRERADGTTVSEGDVVHATAARVGKRAEARRVLDSAVDHKNQAVVRHGVHVVHPLLRHRVEVAHVGKVEVVGDERLRVVDHDRAVESAAAHVVAADVAVDVGVGAVEDGGGVLGVRVDVLPRAGGAHGLGEPVADGERAVRCVVKVGNSGAVARVAADDQTTIGDVGGAVQSDAAAKARGADEGRE